MAVATFVTTVMEWENNMTKLYNRDCLEVLPSIADKTIDSIVCDLPYYNIVNKKWDKQWASVDDYMSWVKKIIVHYKRITKENANIFLFTSRQNNRKICNILDNYFTEKRIIIWARKRGFNQTRGKALSSGYEPICFYGGSNSVFNNIKIIKKSKRKEYSTGVLKDGINLSDVWDDISALPHNAKEKVKHPTQKPLKLIERIITIGSNEGDVILDSCMGSGTTGIACKNLNRDFIGIENNEDYFKIASERIATLDL